MYDVFYNDKAVELLTWAVKVPDRIKQVRIIKAANGLEERYRKYHPNDVTSIYVKGRSLEMIRMLETFRSPPGRIRA